MVNSIFRYIDYCNHKEYGKVSESGRPVNISQMILATLVINQVGQSVASVPSQKEEI